MKRIHIGSLCAALFLSCCEHCLAIGESGGVDFNAPTDLAKFNLLGENVQSVTGAIRVDDQFPYPQATLAYNQRSFSTPNRADRLFLSVCSCPRPAIKPYRYERSRAS